MAEISSIASARASFLPATPGSAAGSLRQGGSVAGPAAAADSASFQPSGQTAGEWNGGYSRLGGLGGMAEKSAGGEAVARTGGGAASLSEDEEAKVRELKETDRQVRNHEQAHMAAGGGLVRGGASYTYEKGPDGQSYAVAGEVSIDASPGRTPQETLARVAQIRAAALAPADPSPQDRRVAASAASLESQARAELAREGAEGQGRGAAGAALQAYRLVSSEGERSAGGREAASRLDLFA